MSERDPGAAFSRRVPSLEQATPFMVAAAARQASDPDFLDLVETNPTRADLGFGPLPAMTLSPAYDPDPCGLPAARAAIAAYYRASGSSVRPEDLVLTASTSEAYAFLFKLLADPGQEMLVPAPSYPLFEHLTLLEGVVPRTYALRYSGRHWEVDVSTLEAGVSPLCRGIVLVHPNNPTGSYAHEAEIESLGRLAALHGLPLIVDEVFFEYPRTGLEFTPARPADALPGNLTFSLGGLSKLCGLPQAKMGWIRVSGPADAKRSALERLSFIADAYLSVGTSVQDVLPALLARAGAVQSGIRERLDRNAAVLHRALSSVPGLFERPREGGWHAVLELPATWTDEAFAQALLEEGVFVHPGFFYDFEEENLIVLSLLTPESRWQRGLERLTGRVARVS